MLAVRHVGVQEPLLNRRQGRFAAEHTLLGVGLFGVRSDRGQCLHSLMLEHVSRAEVNAQLPGTADHLNRQNRIAAQFEEVVVEPHLSEVQHFTPHTHQALLQRRGRRDVVLAIEFRVGRGQGAAIQLAVGGQWHVAQQDQVRGHHVVRQLRVELSLERFAQPGLLRRLLLRGVTYHIRGQLLAARHVQRQHHGLAHLRVCQQMGFNFAQLDAKATNLYLMVNSAHVLN